jgi:hypothetical protein
MIVASIYPPAKEGLGLEFTPRWDGVCSVKWLNEG